jgi:hypothetical protein
VAADQVRVYSDEEIARVCYTLMVEIEDPDHGKLLPWNEIEPERQAAVVACVQIAKGGASARRVHEERVRLYTALGWDWATYRDDIEHVAPAAADWHDLPERLRYREQVFLMVVMTMSMGLPPEN